MNPLLLLPVLVGLAVVVQAGVNRQIADQWGLAGTVLMNSAVVLGFAIVFFGAVKLRPESFPEFLRVPLEPGRVDAWRPILAGLLGAIVVLGLPWGFARLGALEVILAVMVAQVVASIAWDRWVEHVPVDSLRIAGAVVALAGAALASWKR